MPISFFFCAYLCVCIKCVCTKTRHSGVGRSAKLCNPTKLSSGSLLVRMETWKKMCWYDVLVIYVLIANFYHHHQPTRHHLHHRCCCCRDEMNGKDFLSFENHRCVHLTPTDWCMRAFMAHKGINMCHKTLITSLSWQTLNKKAVFFAQVYF